MFCVFYEILKKSFASIRNQLKYCNELKRNHMKLIKIVRNIKQYYENMCNH